MRKVRRWLKKRHHSAESDEDFDVDCASYLANGERRCSEPCRRCSTAPTSPATERSSNGGGATSQPRKRMGNIFSQMLNLNPLVGTLPNQHAQLAGEPGGRPQRRTSGGSGRQSLEFSGEVKREVLSNIRRVSGGERRMVGSGGVGVNVRHSRHSSLGEEPLHTEVIHENPEHEYVVNHRRHVSDSITQSSQLSRDSAGDDGKYNLAKKVEPVSYPGGVKAHLARGQRFHAHDDIMPLVEDWYDSWNLLGKTPIMDPGNGPSSEFVLDAKGGRGSTDNEIRRRTASLSTPHRASDVQVDPAQSAILFRDARGLPALDPFITVDTYQILKNDETKIFAKFFGFHMCYDLIPTSAKLVVFDTQLLVKKAFFALVYNGVRAAPLWDSQQQRFVGMLTITDFIRILAMNYKSPSLEMEELEEHRLETWRNVLKDVKELIFIEPNASLYEAIKSLIHNKIHRLPVIDSTTGNVLYILTHKRILRFLFLYINDLPESSLLHQSVHQLNIGTYDDIEVASEDTPIIEALHKFVNKRISALPIVDKEHRLIDIYAKFDVINLAAEKTYSNLDVSLKEANKHRNEWFEGVHKCTKADTLFEVMDKIVKAEVHRLVIVDESNVVCGMISLSDILNFLVLRPGGDDFFKKSVAETIKTEPNMPEQDDILDKQESAESTSLEKLNNPNLGSKPDEIQPDEDRALNLSQESALSAEKKLELTCEEINEDPGVQSFDASDDVVENRESEDRSLEMNQDAAGDRLTATLDEQDQVTNIILPPLFIESASNSTPSSSPDPGRDLSAPCSPCPPTSSPCPPTSSPCLTIISNDDRPTTPVTMTKEFGKSDSMDSAFEATEEVDEEEPDAVEANDNGGNANFSQDERLVHIQIVDAGGTTTPPATPSPPPPTTCMGKLCDNDMAGGNTTVLSCDMTGHTQSNKLQQILP